MNDPFVLHTLENKKELNRKFGLVCCLMGKNLDYHILVDISSQSGFVI